MKGFIEDLAIANQNYRQQFFDTLVEHHGISEGALVMVRKGGKRSNGEMEKELAIIESIDWAALLFISMLDIPMLFTFGFLDQPAQAL